MVAEQQRADAILALPLPRHPAADDQLLPALVLHLDPGSGAAAGLVWAVEALGHHALEPLLAGGFEQRLALAPMRGGRPPGRVLEPQLV